MGLRYAVMRNKFFGLLNGVRSDAAEHIAKPGERIDLVQFAGSDEGAQNRHGLSTAVATEKRPVGPSDSDAAQMTVVDRASLRSRYSLR